MKLTKWKVDRTEGGHGVKGLVLLDGSEDRILSLVKENDNIIFCEECDGWFATSMSKENAKIALLEALAWIDEE